MFNRRLQKPQRPIFYETQPRPRWGWLIAGLVAFMVLIALAIGAAVLIARMELNTVILDSVHAQGMAAGMSTCGRHP